MLQAKPVLLHGTRGRDKADVTNSAAYKEMEYAQARRENTSPATTMPTENRERSLPHSPVEAADHDLALAVDN